MNDEEKRNTWWSTLPGIMTGLAAAITALAGLVAAITQTGWLTPQPPSSTTTSSPSTAIASTEPPKSPAPAPAALEPLPSAAVGHSAPLPALREYKLGEATFTLLQAEVAAQTTERDALRIRLRMMNHGRFDANFWDNSFRLLVGGMPRAPESGLNDIVPGQSAKEGDVIFLIPHGTAAVTLKITYADDSTEIPLALEGPR